MISETLNLDEFLRQKCFQGRQVETRQFFCTKIESTFPCRVVYVKTRNEFVSLYSRAVDPKRGEFSGEAKLARLLFEYQCQNTNFGIETGLRKTTRKKIVIVTSLFDSHDFVILCGDGCGLHNNAFKEFFAVSREFLQFSLKRSRLFILRSQLHKIATFNFYTKL